MFELFESFSYVEVWINPHVKILKEKKTGAGATGNNPNQSEER